jgi:hypothetical protein
MRRVLLWFQRLWNWLRRRPTPLRTKRALDIPESIEAGTLYLIGEGEHLWSAAFECPCGCGEVVQLSLLRDSRPRWKAEQHADGTVSISPSVWRTKGCKSHFFVRRGLVDWVPAGQTE